MTNCNIGDLIRLSKGEFEIQGRVMVGGWVFRPNYTIDELLASGFSLEVIQPARPPLPADPNTFVLIENEQSRLWLAWLDNLADTWDVITPRGDLERTDDPWSLVNGFATFKVLVPKEEDAS